MSCKFPSKGNSFHFTCLYKIQSFPAKKRELPIDPS